MAGGDEVEVSSGVDVVVLEAAELIKLTALSEFIVLWGVATALLDVVPVLTTVVVSVSVVNSGWAPSSLQVKISALSTATLYYHAPTVDGIIKQYEGRVSTGAPILEGKCVRTRRYRGVTPKQYVVGILADIARGCVCICSREYSIYIE